jgi:2-octaprenyl-6-methoxyphenol hydroxylase
MHCDTSLGNVTARIIAGCDGRGSLVAKSAGIGRVGHEYAQSALVCAVDHAVPHEGCAHQFFTPNGPLAILPLQGNRAAIVWTENRERAARIHAMDDAAYLDALRPVFGAFLGEISLSGQRFIYPLSLDVATEFVADRVVLVGDAAHGIHPLAGQGFNLGLRDSAALAEVLSEARRRGEDIGAGSVAARYQGWRRADTAAMVAATDGINTLFSNDNALLRGLRTIGLGAVNAMPFLRQSAMRHAAGLTGNVPRLMQGKPL